MAPTETGLEHSAAIADSAAVAIGGGQAAGGGGVERVFKAVGGFDDDDNKATVAMAEGAPPVMKVTYDKQSACLCHLLHAVATRF